MKRLFGVFAAVLFIGTVFILATPPRGAVAQSVDELKGKIADRANRLADIEKEIAQYQSELQKVGSEKKTLQNAIYRLELERKKISADISYTQNKIGKTDLEIEKLSYDIGDTEAGISTSKVAIAEILQRLSENDRQSLMESLLSKGDFSDFWGEVGALEEVRNAMAERVRKLQELKETLVDQKGDQEEKRSDLVELKGQYTDQQNVLTNNKAEKNKLLTDTQNKEANYQALLAEKLRVKEQIIKELRDYESKLQFILDPNTIPSAGSAVFSWPLSIGITITQYFGGTEFAKRNPGIYAGRAYHPGIDIAAPVGTKVLAPLDGFVRATGNTDVFPGCYSWGKWTLVDHPNGLSTLYAHQSQIAVSPGQSVKRGDVIGYSGNTGYSTGPHLHFTVYAKAGVSVKKFSEIKTVTNCGAATTPVAATDAYLDPMNYLPAL